MEPKIIAEVQAIYVVRWDCEDGYAENNSAYLTEKSAKQAARDIMVEEANSLEADGEEDITFDQWVERGVIQEFDFEESGMYAVQTDSNYRVVVVSTPLYPK